MAIKKQVKDTLNVVTARMHKEDRDNLTVNTIRNVAELELGLPEGFFKEDDEWRETSRKMIYAKVQELDTIEIAANKAAAKTKLPAAPAKRKLPSPEKEVVLGDEASEGVYDDDDEEEQPRKKVRASPVKKKTPVKKAVKKTPVKKAAGKKTTPKKKAATPSEEEGLSDAGESEESEASFGDEESDAPKKKTATRKSGKKVVDSQDEESALSTPESEDEAPKSKKVAKKAFLKKAAPKKRLVQKRKTVVSDDEDEDELSSPPSDSENDGDVNDINPEDRMAVKKRQRGKVQKLKVEPKKLSSTQVVESETDVDDNDVYTESVSSPAKFLAKLQKKLGSDDKDGEGKSKSPAKSKKKVISNDEDEDEDVKTKSPSKSPMKKKEADEDDSEMSDVLDPSPVKKGRAKATTTSKSPIMKQGGEDEESEMSEVKDPSPVKKGRKCTKSAPKTTKKPAPAKVSDPNAEEIKTLTQQLGKCGVRKVWGAYLKKEFGDDHKAKVRQLKEMLRNVGMEGRFSEQRAREIKEKRELEGDLEVLKETAKKWGASADPFGTSGRPSRRTAASRRSLKEPELSEEEGEDSDAATGSGSGSGDEEGSEGLESDEDVKAKGVKRARKAKKDEGLAFLGSESESD